MPTRGARRARTVTDVVYDEVNGRYLCTIENVERKTDLRFIPRTDLRRLAARMSVPAGGRETNDAMQRGIMRRIGSGSWHGDGTPFEEPEEDSMPEPTQPTKDVPTLTCANGHVRRPDSMRYYRWLRDRKCMCGADWRAEDAEPEPEPEEPETQPEPEPEPKRMPEPKPEPDSLTVRILRAVRTIRDRVAERGIRIIVSPRVALRTASLIVNEGWSLYDALSTSDLGTLDPHDRDSILQGIPDIPAREWSQLTRDALERIADEPKHPMLGRIVSALNAGCHVYLAGPPGTGKSHLASQVARAMNRPFESFGSLDPNMTRTVLFGYSDVTGTYHPSPLARAVENGAILLLDEADNGNPSVLAALNSALANGHAVIDGREVEIAQGFAAIMTANTWGTGPTADFVGRQFLDRATLDRFARIYVPEDDSLTETLVNEITGGQ